MFFLAGKAFLLFFVISLNSVVPNKPNPEITPQVIATSMPVSITPTVTPTKTPVKSPTPTLTPTPVTNSVTPNTKQAVDTTNIGLFLLKQINDFRASKGLSALATDGYTCAFAVIRAGEIVGNFNHDGFNNRIDSKSLPYPSYSSVAENIALNSDYNQVVPGWIYSAGHNENMSKDVSFGCVGRNGNNYVFETWKP